LGGPGNGHEKCKHNEVITHTNRGIERRTQVERAPPITPGASRDVLPCPRRDAGSFTAVFLS
jgi:hypothetical protein